VQPEAPCSSFQTWSHVPIWFWYVIMLSSVYSFCCRTMVIELSTRLFFDFHL